MGISTHEGGKRFFIELVQFGHRKKKPRVLRNRRGTNDRTSDYRVDLTVTHEKVQNSHLF